MNASQLQCLQATAIQVTCDYQKAPIKVRSPPSRAYYCCLLTCSSGRLSTTTPLTRFGPWLRLPRAPAAARDLACCCAACSSRLCSGNISDALEHCSRKDRQHFQEFGISCSRSRIGDTLCSAAVPHNHTCALISILPNPHFCGVQTRKLFLHLLLLSHHCTQPYTRAYRVDGGCTQHHGCPAEHGHAHEAHHAAHHAEQPAAAAPPPSPATCKWANRSAPLAVKQGC